MTDLEDRKKTVISIPVLDTRMMPIDVVVQVTTSKAPPTPPPPPGISQVMDVDLEEEPQELTGGPAGSNETTPRFE